MTVAWKNVVSWWIPILNTSLLLVFGKRSVRSMSTVTSMSKQRSTRLTGPFYTKLTQLSRQRSTEQRWVTLEPNKGVQTHLYPHTNRYYSLIGWVSTRPSNMLPSWWMRIYRRQKPSQTLLNLLYMTHVQANLTQITVVHVQALMAGSSASDNTQTTDMSFSGQETDNMAQRYGHVQQGQAEVWDTQWCTYIKQKALETLVTRIQLKIR